MRKVSRLFILALWVGGLATQNSEAADAAPPLQIADLAPPDLQGLTPAEQQKVSNALEQEERIEENLGPNLQQEIEEASGSALESSP